MQPSLNIECINSCFNQMSLAKIYPIIFLKKIEYMPNNEVKSGFLLIFKMFIA